MILGTNTLAYFVRSVSNEVKKKRLMLLKQEQLCLRGEVHGSLRAGTNLDRHGKLRGGQGGWKRGELVVYGQRGCKLFGKKETMYVLAGNTK
jgi:hypothetical protein